jgi:hypothetical protein
MDEELSKVTDSPQTAGSPQDSSGCGDLSGLSTARKVLRRTCGGDGRLRYGSDTAEVRRSRGGSRALVTNSYWHLSINNYLLINCT